MTTETVVAMIQAAKELTLPLSSSFQLAADNPEWNETVSEMIGNAYATIYRSIESAVRGE
ncbi:hypothetical protein [Alicyclobacillus shizuokensis]|uniref:hypothetical protein n=1 Tax=Alicyclobacillus shizuokensis TaxID=392014 RepID=UPI0008324044|nr:hypothetical protein [Alicyclobacillus shizuokensis]